MMRQLQTQTAQRALEIASCIGRRVCCPDAYFECGNDSGGTAGIAGGTAGTALLSATLHRIEPEKNWQARTHEQLVLAARSKSSDRSLHEGWAGLFAAAGYAAGASERYRKLRTSIRTSLHAYIHTAYTPPYKAVQSTAEFDLVSGAAGLLLVLNAPEDRDIVKVLCNYIDWLTADSSGARWVAPFSRYSPDGEPLETILANNLGLAHGLSGMLAGLALNEHVQNTSPLIARLGEWLLSHAVGSGKVPSWPSGLHDGKPLDERLAWCFGTPGVTASLYAAGYKSERRDWCDAAIEALHAALAPVLPLMDQAICHGMGGLALIAHTIGRHAPDERLLCFAGESYASICAAFDPQTRYGYRILQAPRQWVDSPAFLDGAAGIALTLLVLADLPHDTWVRFLGLLAAGAR